MQVKIVDGLVHQMPIIAYLHCKNKQFFAYNACGRVQKGEKYANKSKYGPELRILFTLDNPPDD